MTELCQACGDTDRGRAWIRVPPKAPGDPARLAVDWHDWLARQWPGAGQLVSPGTVVRLERARSTGLQYRSLSGGVTGRAEPRWSASVGTPVADGTVTWVAEALSVDSIARTVTSAAWEVPAPLAGSAELLADYVYSVLVSGGDDGSEYQVKHRAVFSDGQADTGVLVLLVSSDPAAV